MSEREELMGRIVEFCGANGLNEVYGIIEANVGKYRSLTICKARILDGEIKIYSPKFIQVKWQTAIRALPERDSKVFTSAEHTIAFLKAAFIDHDYKAAEEVPTK